MHYPISRRHWLQAAGALSVASLHLTSTAQPSNWPTKPVKVIVPYSPGGFTDQMARIVQMDLQTTLGQSFVIENKPGANSIIGVDQTAKSPADGYTMAVVIAAYSANPTLSPNLPYDTLKDLRAVSLIGISPLVLVAANNAPFKTTQELIAYAKQNPGKVTYGSSGNGSAAHLTTELFALINQIKMTHVSYKGTMPALTDVMGGQIHMMFDTPSNLIPAAKGGKVRMLGVANEARLPNEPDYPTLIEQGVPGMVGSTWACLIAPAATPVDIIQRVSDVVQKSMQKPDMQKRLEGMGVIPAGYTPEKSDAFIKAEIDKWAKVIKAANISEL